MLEDKKDGKLFKVDRVAREFRCFMQQSCFIDLSFVGRLILGVTTI